jgi:CBS domain-containing protein
MTTLTSTKQELIQQLDRAYREFRSTVEDLDERAFETKWLDDRWGVREIVAHITGWHGTLSKGLERLARGEKAVPEGENWSDTDPANDTFADHAKGKTKDQVLHELDAAVQSFKDAAGRVPDHRFGEGKTANQIFDGAGIEHFAEHTKMIRSWREYNNSNSAGGNMGSKKVRDVMTKDVEVVDPNQTTLQEAAMKMRTIDVGLLPACTDSRLVGMITDRDIAIRAVAEGRDPTSTRVAEVMTGEIYFAREDQDIDEAANLMEEHQVRRLPVLDKDQQLVGIVALGDLAQRTDNAGMKAEVLEEVSKPS